MNLNKKRTETDIDDKAFMDHTKFIEWKNTNGLNVMFHYLGYPITLHLERVIDELNGVTNIEVNQV